LKAEPSYFAAAAQPIINIGLSVRPCDVTNFGSGKVSLDLPIAFRDSQALATKKEAEVKAAAQKNNQFPFNVRVARQLAHPADQKWMRTMA
jgi:hypothetical protein